MTEQEYLDGYNPGDFERPAVTVDLVLMTVAEGSLQVLLMRRSEHPGRDKWALPGSFVRLDEDLDRAASRVLRDKAGLERSYLEQLYTFGAVDRDPRMRIITVAYFALLPLSQFEQTLSAHPELTLGQIVQAEGAPPRVRIAGRSITLAFDHSDIVRVAAERLRAKLDWSDVAYALLPPEFTLRELQEVHETILGRSVNKPAFRKRMLVKGHLNPTGRREAAGAFRPAELYRYIGTSGGGGT
jgi:8-oxo-dGTP diphosphatase